LISAVRARDAAATARLLGEGANPDSCDFETGAPAILLAVMADDLGPSEGNTGGGGPSPVAATSLEIVKLLLMAGADPSTSDKAGRSALLVSILSADFDTASLLLAHKTLPPKLDTRCSIAGIGFTPIAAAFTYGTTAIKQAVTAAAAAVGLAELAVQEKLAAETSEFLNAVCDRVDAAAGRDHKGSRGYEEEDEEQDSYAPSCVRATLELLGIDPDDLDANPLQQAVELLYANASDGDLLLYPMPPNAFRAGVGAVAGIGAAAAAAACVLLAVREIWWRFLVPFVTSEFCLALLLWTMYATPYVLT
jgi:ankyrin repeat protein